MQTQHQEPSASDCFFVFVFWQSPVYLKMHNVVNVHEPRKILNIYVIKIMNIKNCICYNTEQWRMELTVERQRFRCAAHSLLGGG